MATSWPNSISTEPVTVETHDLAVGQRQRQANRHPDHVAHLAEVGAAVVLLGVMGPLERHRPDVSRHHQAVGGDAAGQPAQPLVAVQGHPAQSSPVVR